MTSQTVLDRAKFTFWRYAEWRAVFEWQSFYALRLAMKKLPRGDGHSVIVFPGFAGNDKSTAPMRGLLDDLGYRSYGWGLGSNLVFDNQLEAELVVMLDEIYAESGRKVSLIGWSLGGLFAREIAKVRPQKVRRVITLGSPISRNPMYSSAHRLFKILNGDPHKLDVGGYQNIRRAPPVPTTIIFSKTDGVVAWQGAKQTTSRARLNAHIENIEVPASHLGLGVNPLVMYLLANRLAQAEGEWTPFRPSVLLRRIFK